jgi:hypothetical protein
LLPSRSTSPPTHTAPEASRKPRRLGLYLPWGIALVLLIAWSLSWIWLAGEAEQRIDAGALGLRQAGWRVAWDERRVSGYPFRLDADFTGLRLTDPSGWGLAVPTLKGEAYVFAPKNWVFAAPNGLTFTRAAGGAVRVTGRLLRASVNTWARHPPNISFEGDDLVLAPAPGAQPFWLAGAKTLEFYTRAALDDQGAVFFGLDGGRAAPASLMGRVARDAPVSILLDGIAFRAGAFSGRDWREAASNWTRSGGGLDVRQFTLRAGVVSLDSRRGSLAVDDHGALVGELDATLVEPGRLFTGLKSENGETETQKLTFHDGWTSVGRARLAPAPHLF